MAAAVESPLGTLNATHGLPQMPSRVQLPQPTRHSLRPGSRSSRASSRGSQTAPSHDEQTQSTEDKEVEKDKEKANELEQGKESDDAQQQGTQAQTPSAAPQQQGAARNAGFLGEDFDPTHGAKPYSPFYIHPMTETSKMQLHNEREAIRAGTRSSESNDLESGGLRSHGGGVGGVGAGKDSTSTRPSCDERWELMHKNKKRGWLARFSPRTRFVIKMLLASAVICVMFAVGIGLTLAVSGRPWPATGPTKSD